MKSQYTYTNCGIVVQVLLNLKGAWTPEYAMTNGNDIVADGTLTQEEYKRMASGNLAENIYNWLV